MFPGYLKQYQVLKEWLTEDELDFIKVDIVGQRASKLGKLSRLSK